MAKGPFMEILRVAVGSGSDTVLSTEVHTPNSKAENLAMLIHYLHIKMIEPTFVAGTVTSLEHCVSKRSHEGEASLPAMDDPDLIWRVDRWAQEGILAATFSRGQTGPMRVEFDPPLLYSKGTIYFEGHRSAGGANGGPGELHIGYTLEKVTKEDYIDALVE